MYPKQNDEYLAGYVQALFVHGYNLPSNAATVQNGIIYIEANQIDGNITPEQFIEKVSQATSSLKGIKGVKIKQSQETLKAEKPIDGLMPAHSLFHALIADPKWPRFTLAYQYQFKNNTSKQAFAPNFGASFPIYRGLKTDNFEWEVGIQGGLFALLDIHQNPSALVNADYYISFPVTFQAGPWSAMARVYHQSSHLGDEFMLTPQGKNTTRINLSFEGIDLFLSYYHTTGVRLYGGAGYIIHKDPSDIKPLKIQGGTEYRAENTFLNGKLRPVTGLDIKAEQMARWTPGISFKTGLQIENSMLISNEIQLMLEAYSGKSMNGQFYQHRIVYVGVGLHAFL
jgi:hypothetical protein